MATMQHHELQAWLGPAYEELTVEQVDRVARAATDVEARYPDPDDADLRESALSAAVQYLLGDSTLEEQRHQYAAARRGEQVALSAAAQMALMANADGMSEVEASEAVGINRLTLRRAKGVS